MRGKWYTVATTAVFGIAAAYFQLHWLMIFAIGTVVFLFFYRKERLTLLICFLTFFLAYSYFLYVDHMNTTKISPTQSRFAGEIVSLPELDGDQFTFHMKLNNGEKVRVLYYLREQSQVSELRSYRYGMFCKIEGTLQKPATARNFHAFDFREYLYRQNIHWQLSPDSLTGTSCQAVDESLADQVHRLRGSGLHWIEEHFPERVQGIAKALLFGFRNDIEEQVLAAYRELGIIHLFAISGLHVGLVVGALYFLFIRFGVTKERSLELLFFLIPIYVVMTGAAPSAVRAGCMAMAVLIALRFRRRLHPLDGISGAAILMLIIDPYALFHIGFQLSFLISLGLIVSAPTVQRLYESRLAQLTAISVLAQLIALPVLLYHFYAVSLLNLPLNLLFIPFISLFVLPLLFLSFFLSFVVPPAATFLLEIISVSVDLAHKLLLNLYEWPWGTLVFGKPSLWIVAALFTAIFYGLLKWEGGEGKRRFIKPALAFGAVLLIQWFLPYLSDTGKVTVLDVGQGDSILIELPHRQAVYLIDTGGRVSFNEEGWREQTRSFNVGRDIVLDELRARGIRSIDRLILTHGDRDHIGGAEGLLGHIHIDEIWFGKGPVTKPFAQQLLTQAGQLRIPIVRASEGMSWQAGEALFKVMHPAGGETEANERSIVIAARLGGLTWLFTGDLEKEGEYRLLRDYPQLTIDVLKVAHHGSQTSTSKAFLQQTNPRVALISVGEDNMYGHPHAGVIERLKAENIHVFRTDEAGAIQFQYRKDGAHFDTVLKK